MVDKIEESYVISLTTGKIVATNVSWEEYMERYAAHFCEWIGGTVISMSPIHAQHDKLSRYLATLFDTYFELRPIGELRQAPFVMRIPDNDLTREPDLQIILENNPHNLTDTYMSGPADICVEIVSPESIQRDHGAKFEEYEKAGVPEYWILDPIHRETRFYRMNAEGIYQPIDTDDYYETPRLPGIRIHIPTLWSDPLPKPTQIVQAVQAMLGA